MLHTVAELPQHVLGHVGGILGAKIDADPLGPDQPRDLFDLVHQCLGRVVEQQVRLVEEEHQPRLVRVAHLGQRLEQFGQQPQQERRVEPGRPHQAVGGKDRDHAAPVGVGAHQVGQLQRRLAEDRRAALVLEHQQRALDRPDRLDRDIAITQRQVRALFADPDQQRLKVLEVEQRQPLFVGHAERDVQHTLLRLAQFQQSGQQQRPHLADRGPDRVALLAEEIPEQHRKGGIGIIGQADRGRAAGKGVMQLELGTAGLGQPAQVALHVRQDHRHALRREPLGEDLQRHRLARARRARDQPVTVGVFEPQTLGGGIPLAPAADEDVTVHVSPCVPANFSLIPTYKVNLCLPK